MFLEKDFNAAPGRDPNCAVSVELSQQPVKKKRGMQLDYTSGMWITGAAVEYMGRNKGIECDTTKKLSVFSILTTNYSYSMLFLYKKAVEEDRDI